MPRKEKVPSKKANNKTTSARKPQTEKTVKAKSEKSHLFKSGEDKRRNSKGRPKGAKQKLSEAFLNDLQEAWLSKGKKVIENVILSDPIAFLNVMARVTAKQIAILQDAPPPAQVNVTIEGVHEELERRYSRLADTAAAKKPVLRVIGGTA